MAPATMFAGSRLEADVQELKPHFVLLLLSLITSAFLLPISSPSHEKKVECQWIGDLEWWSLGCQGWRRTMGRNAVEELCLHSRATR